MNLFTFAVFVVVGTHACWGAQMPSNWIGCPTGPNHNECMKGSMTGALADLMKGNQPLKTQPLDPLEIKEMSISQGQGPVKINLDLTDFTASGISDVVLEEVKNDWKTMEMKVRVPKLYVKANYKLDGQVMLLPIKGQGPCELEYDNLRAKLVAQLSEKTQKGETYYHMDSAHYDLEPEFLKIKFDNLFDGNKQLGDQMNVFLNENWKLLFKEVAPALGETFSQITVQTANRVFSQIPKSVLTPK